MKVFNIDNSNITISGNIYCNSDIEFSLNHRINLDYDTIWYDFHIKGNLYIICDKLYLLGFEKILNNSLSREQVIDGVAARTIDPTLSKDYDRNDFRVIKSDRVYIRCPNLKVGKDIYAYHCGIEDELRSLKLKQIKKIYECM